MRNLSGEGNWFALRRIHFRVAISDVKNTLEINHWKDFCDFLPGAINSIYDVDRLILLGINKEDFLRNNFKDEELPDEAFILRKYGYV